MAGSARRQLLRLGGLCITTTVLLLSGGSSSTSVRAQGTLEPTPLPTVPVPRNISCTTGEELVKAGRRTAVCLIVSPLDWESSANYSSISIFPAADQYSRFHVPLSWSAMYGNATHTDPLLQAYGPDVAIHVESNGVQSWQKGYRFGEEGQTFSIFTAIINVDRGNITSITWDDGCHFCAKKYCRINTYDYQGLNATQSIEEAKPVAGKDCFYYDDETCVDEAGNVSAACQLTVFVVWSGTDENGIYFQSQQKRLSLFAGPTVGQYLKNAESTFTDAFTRLT